MSTSKKRTSSPAAAPPRPARIADRVTAVFGSRPFILIQTVLIIVWIGYNGYVAVRYLHGGVFDPYPFILPYLLVLHAGRLLGAVDPVEPNRTAVRDRVQVERDFDDNVVAPRALAELLGDVRGESTRQELLSRVESLLGKHT
jgi:uncharacterized membrane protein